MRLTNVVAAAMVVVLSSAGCVNATFHAKYSIRGSLADAATKEPIAGARVAATTDYRFDDSFDPEQEPEYWPGFQTTDRQGYFDEVPAAGRMSGVTFLFGLIPVTPLPPPPEPLEAIRLHVRRDGEWQMIRVALDSASQKLEGDEMRIDIGVVEVRHVRDGNTPSLLHDAGYLTFPPALVLLAFTVGVGGCQVPVPDSLPVAIWGERWSIVGRLAPERVEGPLDARYVATLHFPENKTMPIAPCDFPAPDGWVPVTWGPLAFNEDAQVLLCWTCRPYPQDTPGFGISPMFSDVCLYDLRAKQAAWIGRKQWKGVGGMNWSSDGTKVAFIGTARASTWKPRPGAIYVYDVAAGELTKVADDGVVRYRPDLSPPPVWSQDGRCLYYASIDGTVIRLELSTGAREALSISALAVVTVKGDDIVLIIRDPTDGEAEHVIKRKLGPPAGDSAPVVLDRCGWIRELVVSPSRRFALYYDWRGYVTGGYVLLDMDTGRTYTRVADHLPSGFEIGATSFSNRRTLEGG
jgi:hypothetical protein